MGYGNLGGLFESSGVKARPNGNMRMTSLVGNGTYAFDATVGPFAWGDLLYMPRSGTGGTWKVYNPITDTVELQSSTMYTDLGAYCAVNGVTTGPIHYLTPIETSANYRVLDVETKTASTVVNVSGSSFSKNVLPILADNMIYYRSGRTDQMFILTKFDLETQTKTTVNVNYPKNITKEPRSITYAGDGIFYITFGNVASFLSDIKDTSITLLKWNERTGVSEIIAESILAEYKYGSLMKYSDFDNQHYTAHFTHLEANRIYMWLRGNRGTSKTFQSMWVVLDIEKKTYEMLYLDSEIAGYNPMGMARTNDKMFLGKTDRYGIRDLFEVEFQKD